MRDEHPDTVPATESEEFIKSSVENLVPIPKFVSANSDTKTESFSPSRIPSFTPDYPMPPGIEDDDYDSERDILILKDMPSHDTLSLPEKESFHFDIPSFSHPPVKPLDGDT
nr:hypothetical protein [Tanacetum cinerariifolium]